ncbi:MAG: hypothetical protein IJ634_08160 [Bacteroidales bacterium]|nr:hypothetical protein [Bacteroidales bacterium]
MVTHTPPSALRASTSTGATGPSATCTCSQSASKRPSPSNRKSPLFRRMKRLASVMCMPSDRRRIPIRSTPLSCDDSSTINLNNIRLPCCFSVRGLRTLRGRARRHHCPRHS